MIETAVGVENALEIANSSPRVTAIAIGGQDLAADMGITLEDSIRSLDYASQRIVMAAKAAHIDVMDTVFVDIDDEDGLRAAARHAKQIGFTGKAAINPRQIDIINEVFTPSDKEIADAIDVVAAYQAASGRRHRRIRAPRQNGGCAGGGAGATHTGSGRYRCRNEVCETRRGW